MSWRFVADYVSARSGETYTVKVNEQGRYGCDCKGWIFCRGARLKPDGSKRCVHTDDAEAKRLTGINGVPVRRPAPATAPARSPVSGVPLAGAGRHDGAGAGRRAPQAAAAVATPGILAAIPGRRAIQLDD